MKEMLLNTQPKLMKVIGNAKRNNRISHAYLLVGDETLNLTEIANFIVQSFLCQEDQLACEKCNTCRRIQSSNYADFIYYDAKEEKVGKEEIINIKENFIKTAQENNKKIYVIDNVEEVTSSALNALLLFLEEPVDDVIAIFTTNKLNKVLTTIKSRCQILKLQKNLHKNINNDRVIDNYLRYFVDDQKEQVEELFPKFLQFLKLYIKRDLRYIIYLYQEVFKDKNRDSLTVFTQMMKILTNDLYSDRKYHDDNYQWILDNFEKDEITKFLSIGNTIQDNNFKGSNFNLLVDKLIFLLEAQNE